MDMNRHATQCPMHVAYIGSKRELEHTCCVLAACMAVHRFSIEGALNKYEKYVR